MNITNSIAQTQFGHSHNNSRNSYSPREKAIIAATTALGIGTSLAVMAKRANYSLKPSKMLKNLKNSYLWRMEIEAPQVIGMGIGTCLGGLAGGYLVDHEPQNRRAKRREAVMQIGNISIPILTVAMFDKLTSKSKPLTKCIGTLGGIFVGVYAANFLMNKLSNVLFKNKDERGVKIVDFSAHLDDLMAGAGYISKSLPEDKPVSRNIKTGVHWISRAVPLALMFPGIEVGTKKAGDNYQ